MVGIQAPTSGSIRIGGHDIVSDAIEAKRRLAFMPDEPQLFEYLTVREHLDLVGRLYGVPANAARLASLLGELELTGKEAALPGELSRGMKQKLTIACGLLHEPPVLLFDEPLTGLDPIGIRRMKQTIVARAKAGAAVVVSSHLLHMVEEICTRILIIDKGRKIADGSLEELASRSDLAAAGSDLERIFLRATGHGDGPAS
jgi:ABC-2 type transport system ATP-binding protein